MYMIEDVAALIGVSYWQLYRAHRTGKLAEPAKNGRYRLYTEADVERVKAYFTAQKNETGDSFAGLA